MTNLYNKNKLTFSLVMIGLYVVLSSIADSVSQSLGIEKIATAILHAAMVLVLYIWLKKQGLAEEYGLCTFKGGYARFLYFVPLLVLVTANLWNGAALNMPVLDTAFYVASMLCVGFIEELVFRGFLFKTLLKSGVKSAFAISSLTFGIGHIVNLLNGAELFETLLQIVSAVAIGFMFTLVFYKGKSLWPCIVTHSLFNSMSAFGIENHGLAKALTTAAIMAISLAYALAIWALNRKKKTYERD